MTSVVLVAFVGSISLGQADIEPLPPLSPPEDDRPMPTPPPVEEPDGPDPLALPESPAAPTQRDDTKPSGAPPNEAKPAKAAAAEGPSVQSAPAHAASADEVTSEPTPAEATPVESDTVSSPDALKSPLSTPGDDRLLATGDADSTQDGFWDPEVVTPTGQPTRISETPSATFVVTGDEIRRSGAESLPEILRRIPGLDVRELSASDGQVSARGFVLELSNRILVLVDGRTTAIDFFGATVFDLLEISTVDIDRIEVVLGPGASVYGNKAMNGTINIITRSAADYPRLEAASSVGPNNNLRAGFRWGFLTGPWRLRATGSLRQLALYDFTPTREAVETQSGTLALGYSPSPNFELSIEGGITRGNIHVIAVGPRVEPFRALLGYVKAEGRRGLGGANAPYGELRVRAVWNTGEFASTQFSCSLPTDNDCPFSASYDTPFFEVSHALSYELGIPMQLRWGGEIRLMQLQSTITSNEKDIVNLAAFASNELLLDNWRLSAGLRLDRQTFTMTTLSPRLSAVYTLAKGHQLRGAFNIGYNNPEPVRFFADFELAPGVEVVGSDTLLAERVYYGEIGYGGVLHPAVRVFANVFVYRMLNYVAINASDVLTTGEMPFVNNDPLDSFGGEIGLNANISSFVSAYMSYAHLKAVGRGDFPYRGRNLGSPEHKFSAGGRMEPLEGFFLTLDGQYFSSSEVDRVPADPASCFPQCLPFEVTKLGTVVMLHGRAGYADPCGVEVSAAATNILDDRTQQFPGGERPHRRIMFTLGYYP